MSILTTQETKDVIIKEVSHANGSIQIISAFCKLDTIKDLIDKNINKTVSSKKLLVRFRLCDILAGATDINLYNYCKENGWEFYIRFDLHAKTYIFDKKRCILGSSNLTNRGFGFCINGNVEFSSVFDIEESDNAKIDLLFENSLKVDDHLFSSLKLEFEEVKKQLKTNTNLNNCTWSKNIYEQFSPNLKVLFSFNFPSTKCPILYDPESISFLDCQFPASEVTIKECFLRSNCYHWLKKVLTENGNCLYFGSIAKLLHDTLISDPKPYRKDVKEYLANLLNWIEYFDIDEIQIDRPNYAQRVLLKSFKEKE